MHITLALLLALAAAQAPSALTGTVIDSSGAPVADANIRVEQSGVTAGEARTGSDGRFEVAIADATDARVTATAPGFSASTVAIPLGTRDVQITLDPAPFFEAVNVTSSRTDVPRSDPTSTVTVISSTELLSSAAVTIDDALKMVPGFTLFRRTSSRNANPTAQGVALRGVGGSSPSRALVLADGVPLNDAFGGWVFWDRVPQVAIDRIEVQRGGSSDLYGADALGGVVQLLTVRPSRPTGRALFEGGNLGTGRVSTFGGGRAQSFRWSAAGEWFNTDGYIPVATEQAAGLAPRGPIDTKAGSTHSSGLASIGYQGPSGWRVDGTVNVFSEDRENGNPQSINSTAFRQGGVDAAGGIAGGLLSARGYGGTQQYHQTFTTVNATRTAETFIRDQNVPTTFGGVGAQWFRAWGAHTLLFGAEGRFLEGKSVEMPFVQGRPGLTTEAGGSDRRTSAFIQDTIEAGSRLTVVLGAHGDNWESTSNRTDLTKSAASFNPRAAASYRLADTVTVRGAVYHGFRAPTLNELYRNFSAGNTQTLANDSLDPERLTGGDIGVMVGTARASARVTGFWNVLDHAITAVTLPNGPPQIIRQRANADRLRATGLEIEGDVRLPRSLAVTFATGITNSHFKGSTSLRDNRVPQVAKYNVGLGVRYSDAAWTASTQLRITGPQFEDDLNTLTLRRATVLDVFGSRTIVRRISAFVGVENLFDEIYDVGRTPILTTGLPRAARVGVLVTLP